MAWAASVLCPLLSPTEEVDKQENSLTGPPDKGMSVPVTSVQFCADSDSHSWMGETSFHKHFGVCTRKVLPKAALPLQDPPGENLDKAAWVAAISSV